MHCEDENHPKLTKLSTSRSMPELDRLPWLTDSFNKGCDHNVDSGTGVQGTGSPEARAPSPIALGPPPALPYGPFLPDVSPVPSLIYKDVQDPEAERGKTGFHNLGNTCFMNAGVQCLLSNPQMSKYFLEQHSVDPSDTTLLSQYNQILHKVWQGKYSILNLLEFKRTLGLYHPQFQDYRQHDCQEFLALVLDSLHEELNSQSCAKLRLLAPPTSEAGPSSEGENSTATAVTNQLSYMDEDYDGEERVTSTGSAAGKTTERPEKVTNKQETGNNSSKNVTMITQPEEEPQHETATESKEQESTSQPDDTSMTDLSQSDLSLQSSGDHQAGGSCTPVEKEVLVLNNAQRKFPTLEDLYMKDTKVLNVNMLATEFEVEEVALGSEKYHKPDNRDPRAAEDLEDAEDLAAGMMEEDEELLAFEGDKSAPLKPLKETNLLANHKEKFSDDPYGKKLLFSDYCNREDETDCSINNIKRIKIDEEVERKEKNVPMRKFTNVNWEGCKQEVRVDTCAGTSQEGGATGWCKESGMENNENLVDDQRLKQLSPQSNQKSLSRSQVELHGMSPPAQLPFNNEAYMWSRYSAEADREWKRYLEKNNSVIVNTFQGQFKSTVVCSECHHVSVTFEPFMYLSVPLPHAMERQLSVIFVPCDNKQPIRYLLTLHKNDKVGELVKALRRLIKEESCDLMVAEVFDNHIARTLDDQIMLRYVNDDSRTLYAFEMLPAPAQVEANLAESIGKPDLAGHMTLVPNNAVPASSVTRAASSSSSSTSVVRGDDSCNNVKTASASCTTTSITEQQTGDGVDVPLNRQGTTEGSGPVSSISKQEVLNNSVCSSGTSSHTHLELRNDIHWQTNLLNPGDHENNVVGNNTEFGENQFGELTEGIQNYTADAVKIPSGDDGGMNVDSNNAERQDVSVANGNTDNIGCDSYDCSGEQMELSKWRSCAICLEEMTDAELMIHAPCGGTLCHNCLEMSFKHYGEAEFICPVCSQAVIPAEDFVQVNCMADYKPKTRILCVPVMQRHEEYDNEGKQELSMFGHPNLLYLPSDWSGEMLYNHVDRVVPILANYTIVLTDGQGLRCSRCLYTDYCTGCLLLRDEPVTLQPGDHLTVCFTGLDIVQRENVGTYEDHKSVEEARSKHPLTLSDCFTAFTQSERLDEHNPWYCPRCCKNQCANKTMTVWRFPKTLVVYLKRFVFHDLTSTKIENKVVFPLDNLDLYHFISGPKNTQLNYSLQSCVCHYGGVNSGHYTAYAKHPQTNKWFYFNDEQISERQPDVDEYSSAYVLFYQRQGGSIAIKSPSHMDKEYPLKGGLFAADVDMTDACQSTSDPWLCPAGGGPAHPQSVSSSSQPMVLNNAKTDSSSSNNKEAPDSTSSGYDFYA